jgi:hypothetical protein
MELSGKPVKCPQCGNSFHMPPAPAAIGPPAIYPSNTRRSRAKYPLRPLLKIAGASAFIIVTLAIATTLIILCLDRAQEVLKTSNFNPTDLDETIYTGQQVTWQFPVISVDEECVRVQSCWNDTVSPRTGKVYIFILDKYAQTYQGFFDEEAQQFEDQSKGKLYWLALPFNDLKVEEHLSLDQAKQITKSVTIEGTVSGIDIKGSSICIQLKNVRAL